MVRFLVALSLVFVGGWACGPGPSEQAEEGEASAVESALRIPRADRPGTVDVGSWNVEWLGSTEQGPADEARQQANVARVLAELDLDLVGLVEVVDEAAFRALLARLPDHDGLLVTDPRVAGGAGHYRPSEQKVALIHRKRFRVESARVVLTHAKQAFAGRPPLEVTVRFSEGGRSRSLVVVVAHFKAMANWDGYQRRQEAAGALKGWLDAEYPSRWVLVVGDFNDDLDVSTYRGKASPFAALVGDAHYRFTTDALTAGNVSTTLHFPATIDHHLATDELGARFVEGSAQVLRVDAYVPSYGATTSDHFPVLTRYRLD